MGIIEKIVSRVITLGIILLVGFFFLEKPTQIKVIRGIEVIFDKDRDEYVNIIYKSNDNSVDNNEETI